MPKVIGDSDLCQPSVAATDAAQSQMLNKMISAIAAIRPPIRNGAMVYFIGSRLLNLTLTTPNRQVIVAEIPNEMKTFRGSGRTEGLWSTRRKAYQNAPLATSPLKNAPMVAPARLARPRKE